MEVATHHALIETILDAWQDRIGPDHAAYRGHVYRTFNFARALVPLERSVEDRLAVAASFHDLGLWPSLGLDYLGPSVERLRAWLAAHGHDDWAPELALAVELHHKLTPYRGAAGPVVEALRRADLVDLTFGTFGLGIPRPFIREVREAFPARGFQRRVTSLVCRWALRHPLQPLPIVRW